MEIDAFNQLSGADAEALLFGCCHCRSFCQRLAASRPFESLPALLVAADTLWADVGEAEILESFQGHARIGDIELLRSKYAGKANDEQGQVLAASEDVIEQLYLCNQQYEEKYGFIFVVCASGKSADFMLKILQQRLQNNRAAELKNGAAEQGKITDLRLRKLIQG